MNSTVTIHATGYSFQLPRDYQPIGRILPCCLGGKQILATVFSGREVYIPVRYQNILNLTGKQKVDLVLP